MPKAVFKNTTIAQSDDTTLLEGNHYFPPETVNREYLVASDTRTVCPWKGTASYYHVVVGGEIDEDAAWYYPEPSAPAVSIKDHVAFCGKVEVIP
ncbi:MAG: DUF427 domain-containing protein [bacterium]|nr:DUF427 domain-containing protein [bacterium]MDT8396679.1 DUF427 domain-containing protein [bacterium]